MAKVPAVLIIDENDDSRVDVRKLLLRAGLDVAGEARYGVNAAAAAHELQPDAVLIGLEDPPNRALETVEHLSQLLLETPIIGYSAQSDTMAMRRAMRSGVRDYLVRPLDVEMLRDAVFSALEQEEQRQLRRTGQVASTVRGTVVTVTGAKGGVGKSVIAINLALALRRATGRSVALVDADTHFGDIATMLNLPTDFPVTRTLTMSGKLDRASVTDLTVEHSSGIRVLPTPADPEEWTKVSPEDVERGLGLLAEAFDFVVIDTPDVFDPVVEQCVIGSTLSLLVSNLDMSSISDCKQALKIFRRWNCPPEKVRLTVNFTRQPDGLTESDVEQALNWPIFWSVPYDRRVPAAAQLGESLVLTQPKAGFSRNFHDLARAISGSGKSAPNGATAVKTARAGGVRRLLNWRAATAG